MDTATKVDAERQADSPAPGRKRILSFAVAAPHVLWAWEERLQAAGYPLDDLDLSDGACILLAATDAAIHGGSTWLLEMLAREIRAPAKTRGSKRKLSHWVIRHWHRADVRRGAARALRASVLPGFHGKTVDAERLKKYREQGTDWVQVLWSAWEAGPEAIESARQAWGAEDWDRRLTDLLEEVRPALWVLLVLPEIERIREDEAGARAVRDLQEKIEALSWEADQTRQKHRRATDRVRDLAAENEALRAELARRDERIRELEEAMAQEREAWISLLNEARASRGARAAEKRSLPLAGKRVVIVGGDPVAPGAMVLIESLGGEAVFCPGFEQEARVADAVAAADLVVAVTSYMSHKHWEQLKLAMPPNKSSKKLILVNSTGLTAIQRALGSAISQADRDRKAK